MPGTTVDLAGNLATSAGGSVPTGAAAGISADSAALARAAQRLQAWAATRPDAALLARYAALAVRVDAPLLRRLRLQLLPRAEPGIEADLWLSGLHESQGRNGFVFDARVQQLLRRQLAAPVPAGRPWPLAQAWAITQGLHADWPEALRTEEALTFHALCGAPDSAARTEALLAPALKAMASGGAARALEVARWAQRAVPRLPDAARQHPAALALWLGALLRLGLPAAQLPDSGAAGLPPQLRWLLPPEQLATHRRLALTPFDDALRLQPLADGAPPAAQEITLPGTRPLLLALRAQGADGAQLLQRTLALDTAAGPTRLPLPPGWQTLDLHGLSGEGWRLQRQAGSTPVEADPLPWQRMQVQVLGEAGPVGLGVFLSPTEVVTVVDVLPPALVQAFRADPDAAVQRPAGRVQLHAWEADGDRQALQGLLVALDPRSPLALLALQRPFAGAIEPSRALAPPASGTPLWLGAGLHARSGRWTGVVQAGQAPTRQPAGRAAPDALARHVGLQLAQPLQALAGIAGAPVFANQVLVGLADLASAEGAGAANSTLWMVPAPAIDRFLAWARDAGDNRPLLLLQHADFDPEGGGAQLGPPAAVGLVREAASRARLHLVHAGGALTPPGVQDGQEPDSFSPGLAAAVRLTTPVTRENHSAHSRQQLLALAARRWARPDFGILQLGARTPAAQASLPPPLAKLPVDAIEGLHPDTLARRLLDLTDPPDPLPPGLGLPVATGLVLRQQFLTLARPFMPPRTRVDTVLQSLQDLGLPAVADAVVGRWNSSSRLDAGPLVELLAQLALPVRDDGLLDQLRAAPRGAVALNAMPVQFVRLLIARANAGRAATPCVVVREQDWAGERSVARIQALVLAALAGGVGCSSDEAGLLLQRLDLAVWVLVTTRPLPDQPTLQALVQRLPSARFVFLAGQQPDLPAAAAAIGAAALPALPDGADLQWLAGYKRLMEWAHPRKRPTRAATKPLKK